MMKAWVVYDAAGKLVESNYQHLWYGRSEAEVCCVARWFCKRRRETGWTAKEHES